MVNTLRLASYHLLLWLVASLDTLLVSPMSSDTYAGLQNTLAFFSVFAHGTCDTKSEAQKHSLIFLNQSYELTSSSKDNIACNNFVI